MIDSVKSVNDWLSQFSQWLIQSIHSMIDSVKSVNDWYSRFSFSLLSSFEIRARHSPGFGLPSVAILPLLCRKRREAIFIFSFILLITTFVVFNFFYLSTELYWEWNVCLNLKICKYVCSNWTNMSIFQPLEVVGRGSETQLQVAERWRN